MNSILQKTIIKLNKLIQKYPLWKKLFSLHSVAVFWRQKWWKCLREAVNLRSFIRIQSNMIYHFKELISQATTYQKMSFQPLTGHKWEAQINKISVLEKSNCLFNMFIWLVYPCPREMIQYTAERKFLQE